MTHTTRILARRTTTLLYARIAYGRTLSQPSQHETTERELRYGTLLGMSGRALARSLRSAWWQDPHSALPARLTDRATVVMVSGRGMHLLEAAVTLAQRLTRPS